MSAGTPERRFRFGVFEVDVRSGEARKAVANQAAGSALPVLVALLERPGDVVTREELRSRIWPNGSLGDFDHALSVAIAKVRSVLDDSRTTHDMWKLYRSEATDLSFR